MRAAYRTERLYRRRAPFKVNSRVRPAERQISERVSDYRTINSVGIDCGGALPAKVFYMAEFSKIKKILKMYEYIFKLFILIYYFYLNVRIRLDNYSKKYK